MTRRIPVGIAKRPLHVAIEDDDKTTVAPSSTAAAIGLAADKVGDLPAANQNFDAITRPLQGNGNVAGRDDEAEQRQIVIAELERVKDQLNFSDNRNHLDSTVLSYCQPISEVDYRNEGLLPLGVLIDEIEGTKFWFRVYAIGLQRKTGGQDFEFVIYCDKFSNHVASFRELPSVVRQRSAHPLRMVEIMTISLGRPTHAFPAHEGARCGLIHLTYSENSARGWRLEGWETHHVIDTKKALAAWEKDFLSNVRGEDILKKVTALNLYAIHEIVAKAKECGIASTSPQQ